MKPIPKPLTRRVHRINKSGKISSKKKPSFSGSYHGSAVDAQIIRARQKRKR